MERRELLMVGPLASAATTEIEKDVIVHRYWEAEDKPALLAEIADRATLVATSGHYGCSAEIMEALPKLELIASFGVGYDAVDITAAKRHNIRVTNTPDVLNDCVAEMTLALMLAACHRIPQADRYVRDGLWPSGNFPLTPELTGRTVGILGLGRIGKEIARRLQVLKMHVVYHGRQRQEHEPFPYYADLVAMARDVDWLVVIAPGSASTTGIVSREVMQALGPEGTLVNMARGSLVDEPAMVELLATGALGGAALDVFADEPNVPAELLGLPNVVLSPHQGSATHKTRAAMAAVVVANLRAHMRGDPLVSPVA
ncbi:D-2-hydroxyacid dehydrogenase [Aureimonas sp. SA4125]|uniref:2-hydroxyacid dehydrogenase n=1 Tax=Aureimonas sp. SA4125 TaxID=2826993 RepID=UPI001CC3D2AB|nr:2-hydroxyacid dehydrogenase [Aureimonas sp. SA4125]BDA84908.1 D-2-hydroxyacid dehydrogenase [Aureimonas sp. SA4125]